MKWGLLILLFNEEFLCEKNILIKLNISNLKISSSNLISILIYSQFKLNFDVSLHKF